MRIVTWNINGANKKSLVWDLILELKPDLVFLQEVGNIPESVEGEFNIISCRAVTKRGTPQKFSTVILVKGKVIKEINLRSEHEWINRELEFFKGNFVSSQVKLNNSEILNVVSVYSPHWPVDKLRLEGVDTSSVKLLRNPDVWGSQVIWSALKSMINTKESWAVGGDFNSSETFDREWQNENIEWKKTNNIKSVLSGHNREHFVRMRDLGLNECLREFNNEIIPTYKNTKGNKIIHQMDHLYVTNNLYNRIRGCVVGDKDHIFGNLLSDHLPIIADFD